MDFTIKTYQNLCNTLLNAGYQFSTLADANWTSTTPIVVMRHDVDRLPKNALVLATIEYKLNIKASYYFRIIPSVFNVSIIKEIASMGHEIGYHYEDLTLAKGNIDKAYTSFCNNLELLRQYYPVRTICMHGSPLSKWDSKDIWKKYNYKELGIIAEPYFDIDYHKVFYLTDTGRSWNNNNYSIRDVVNSGFDIKIKNTHHLIGMIASGNFPHKILINTHPQRWHDFGIRWIKELILQNIKNLIKSKNPRQQANSQRLTTNNPSYLLKSSGI